MTLNEWQKKVDDWIKKHGVRYFNEITNTLILMEEVGEFARHVSRKYGEQSYKSNENPDDIKKELMDIFFVITCLANQMGINLEDELMNHISHKAQRDHSRHHSNSKLRK
ncbi:MAG: nucleotide pyrophosphohydrolase [Bacteroidales bacterium]|nr:nucleotide pyrophosphohydrolase [Bacteroidales bacterium]